MLDFNFHLTTPRLYISYLNPANDAHCELRIKQAKEREPPVLIPDLEAERKLIQDGIEKMERSGHGRYLISLRPSNTNTNTESPTAEEQAVPFSQRKIEHIGSVSMQLNRFPGAPTIPDVGFGLLRKHFGRGYATEAAQALLKYFEEEKGQTAFAGYCSPKNEASKNVFKRLGFEDRGVRNLLGIFGEGEEHVLRALVWTKGVGEGDEELKRWGI